MKNIYTLIVLSLIVTTSAIAQITGPATVYVGTTTSYSYNDGNTIVGAYWTATKGNVDSYTNTGTNYTSSITWTTTGSALVRIYGSDGLVSSKSVTVNTCSIGAPTGTGGSRCGTGTVSLSATVGSGGTGVRWYSASTGGSVLGSSTSFTTPSISTTTTYYVTTYNSTTLCESSPRVAVTASVSNTGAISPATVNAFNSMSGIQTLSGHTGTPLRWEKNTNSGGWTTISNTTASNSYSVGPISSTTVTQYRAVLNNFCGNPSYSALSTINVYPNPPAILVNGATPSSTTVYRNYGYDVTLSIPSQTYYSTYQWFQNGSVISGAQSSSYNPAAPGVYTLTVTLTGGASYTTPTGITVVMPNLQSDSVNIVSRTTFTKSGVTTATSRYTLTPSDLQQSLYYSDGIGRTVQTIGVGQSAIGTDLVIPSAYGKQGIVDSVYLPYAESGIVAKFRKDAIKGSSAFNSYSSGKQYNAYQQDVSSKIAIDSKPYAVTAFYNTPDARVRRKGSPGSDWQPGQHDVQVRSRLSTSSYCQVRRWKSNGTTTDYYPDNTVTSTVVKDENGYFTRTFVDMRGLTVLKQVQVDADTLGGLKTYYVYDDYGQLTMQIPPQALNELGTGSTLDANNSSVAELMFKYDYDSRGRLIRKKVPGSAVQEIIYDQFDRIVLTQDALQRSQNIWMFNKYDSKNRLAYAGIYASSSNRATLQARVDSIGSYGRPYYESPDVTPGYQGYSNVVFPTSNTIQRVYYYDDYDFDRNGTADYTYSNSHLSGLPTTANLKTRGLPTGSKILRLGTTDWMIKCVFYDDLDRPIQIMGNNPMILSMNDKTSILYQPNSITNTVQKIAITEAGTGSTVNVVQRYTYDNAWRPTAIYHSINGSTEIKILGLEYNAIGQLVTKKLHDTGTALQNIDLRYNIRGWLTSINNARLAVEAATNSDTNDYFGMDLLYNVAEVGLGNTARYDGSISVAKWKNGGVSSGAADQRSYKYSYDNSGRLLSGTFQAYNGASWTKETNTLNETMTYNQNGNIQTLVRNQNSRGLSGTTVTSATSALDNLSYTYSTTNQNRLLKVTDAGDVAAGFVDGVNSTSEYRYDTLGSLTIDRNKGISNVTYNHLGKPTLVNFANGNSISYEYYATGERFKTVNTVNSVATTTVEIGSSTYINNVIKYVRTPVGRVIPGGTPEYQYFITDHLGNNRVVFTSATPTATVTTATFEGDANDQSGQFLNVVAPIQTFTAANHTSGGSKVIRLNQTYNTGPAYSRKVYPGDKIDMEVWTYYEPTSGWSTSNQSNSIMISAIAGAFGGVSGGAGEAGKIYNGVSSAIGGFGLGANQDDNSPTAFLNYILFDKNYKVLNMGWTAVPESANFSKQKMSIPQVTAPEAGYIFVYLSYEGQSSVYANFDDFKVTYTPTNIIQSNEYYPFGLQTANSWTRENALANDFLANGGTKFNVTSSLYDLEFRNYDPILGRMNQVDPMADTYGMFTPYHYSVNNPVSNIDLNGAEVIWGLYSREDYNDKVGQRDQVAAIGLAAKPRYGGNGDYYYDANGNNIQDIDEERMTWEQTKSYYGSSLQVTSISSATFKAITDANNKTITYIQNSAQQGTQLTQDEVNAFFLNSFYQDFLSFIGNGRLPDISLASQDLFIESIRNALDNVISEDAGRMNRTLKAVKVDIYSQDATGSRVGPQINIFNSPTFNPMAPVFYSPGTSGDHSEGFRNLDGSKFRIIVEWQEVIIN